MVIFKTEVDVEGLTGNAIYDFFINCTAEEYQKWWEGTHLIYRTLKRYPDDFGNVVLMDEYIGIYRVTLNAVVSRAISGVEIVWQMKKIVKMPAWVSISFEERKNGVKVIHKITAGFKGIGKIFDVIFKIFLSRDFEKAMDEHAKTEFLKLRAVLQK